MKTFQNQDSSSICPHAEMDPTAREVVAGILMVTASLSEGTIKALDKLVADRLAEISRIKSGVFMVFCLENEAVNDQCIFCRSRSKINF